jgi:hypothetical protein
MVASENPEIKKNILYLLDNYRKKYIVRDTLTTQEPEQVTKTIKILEQKGTELNNYYNYPSQYIQKDNSLSNLIYLLNKVIEPDKDNPIYNVLIANYIDNLFIKFPLTPNHSHIYNNLLR